MIPILEISLLPIIKIMFLSALGVYVAFGIIVVRQVQLMTQTLRVGFEAPIKLLGILHLLVAIAVFILALMAL